MVKGKIFMHFAIENLKPRVVINIHPRTASALDKDECLFSLSPYLKQTEIIQMQTVTNTVILKKVFDFIPKSPCSCGNTILTSEP